MEIKSIKKQFRRGEYRLTKHAIQKKIEREISTQELEEAVLDGEIIEQYPEDKYGPSLLIYGKTKQGRHLHVHSSYSEIVWVITAYEPDEKKWIDFKVRKK